MYQPERPLEPPEPVVVYYCDWCGEDICEGDNAYKIDEATICERCIEDCRFIVEPPEEDDE